jgi:uncharacterized protein YggL (DUF469 family)
MSPACPVFGFRVDLRALDGSATTRDRLERLLAATVIDPRGLILDRVSDGPTRSLLIRSEAGQATNEDRVAVLEWARTRRAEATIDVGDVQDVGTLA